MDVYCTLRHEINNDPLSRGYAGMTNAEIADSLNNADRTRFKEKFMTKRSLLAELDMADVIAILTALATAAADNGNPYKMAYSLAQDWLSPMEGGVDIGHPKTQALLDGLVPYGIASSDQINALKALGTDMVSRATELGLPFIYEVDVAVVRPDSSSESSASSESNGI